MSFWTEMKIAELRAGFAVGRRFSDLAREIGCSTGSLISKAYRLGLLHKRNPAPVTLAKLNLPD